MRTARHWRAAASALAMSIVCGVPALAQPLAMTDPSPFPNSIFQQVMPERAAPQIEQSIPEASVEMPAHLRRQMVNYSTREPAGTIVIDTANTYLYYVLGGGRAIRYGIGVGREGFTWSGTRSIDRKTEWPDWHPPAEMIARQPYLPRFMAGGEGNPLGARAMYLGGTLYRIHGTNQPTSIGQKVSSGCIRMVNEDVIDLYSRAQVGTRVVVLPDGARRAPSQQVAVRQERIYSAPVEPREYPVVQREYYEAPRPVAEVPFRPMPLFGSSSGRIY